MTKRPPDPGPSANQGFGPPGSRAEQRGRPSENAPAEEDETMQRKAPGADGLDPEALKKATEGKDRLVPREHLDEDVAVTGAPPDPDEGDESEV
jgi:hypothetical protein